MDSLAVVTMASLTSAGITPEQLSQMQGSAPGGGLTPGDAQNANKKKQEQEGQRQEMLTRMMAPEAKERLNRISLVKPDKVWTHPLTAHPPPPAHTSRTDAGTQAGGHGADDGAAQPAAGGAL